MEVTINPVKPVSAYAARPAPAAPPSEPGKPPTAEEIAARAKETAISMGWQQPEPPAEPAQPPAPATPIPPIEPPVARVAPAAPAPSPAPATALIADDDQINRAAKAAARETANLMRPEPATPAPEAPAAPAFELTPEDQRDYGILMFMARRDAAKHGNKPQQFLDYCKKHYEYQTKWLADHEGEEYDPEAKEHRAWYAANQAPISTDELSQSEIDMRVDAGIEAKLANDPRLKKVEQIEEAENVQQHMEAVGGRNIAKQVVAMVDGVNPALGKLLRNAQGAIDLTKEAEALVDAADPIAKAVMSEIAQRELVPMITELELLAVPGTKRRMDPNRNQLHAMILRYQSEAEREILAGPVEEQMFDGRKFATAAQMARWKNDIEQSRRSEADKERKLADLDNGYYTLTIDDMQEIISDQLAAKAKAEIQKIEGLSNKKYGRAAENGGVQPAAPAQPPAPAHAPPSPPALPPSPPPANFKPRPPSGGGGADVVTNPNPTAGGTKTFGQEAVSVAFK